MLLILLLQLLQFDISCDNDHFSIMPEPSQIHLGSGDHIYLADPENNQILRLDSKGTFINSFGRKGEGPGEFKRWFGSLSISPNGDIYQMDYFGGNPWINVFNSDGSYKKMISLETFTPPFGPDRMIFVAGKEVLGMQANWHVEKRGPLFFGTADSKFFDLKTQNQPIFSTSIVHEISLFPDREGRPIPGQDQLFTAAQGNTIVFQRASESLFTRLNLTTGKKERRPNGLTKKPMTKEAIEAFRNWRIEEFTPPEFRSYEKQLYAKMVDYANHYEAFQPIIERIITSPDQTIYLVPASKNTHFVMKIKANGDLQKVALEQIPCAISKTTCIYLETDQDADQYTLKIRPRPKQL